MTYVTNTPIGNITVNADTTINSLGTAQAKSGGSVVNVADGVTLTWTNQSWSTTSGLAIWTKSGNGTWNIGAQGNATVGSSFTLNAGTVIVPGNNSFGGSASLLTVNGGTISSSSTRNYPNGINVGGDFGLQGTGNATFSGTVGLNGATRTIRNDTQSGSRIFSGVIAGSAGTGLTFTGTGAGQTYIGNAANTFTGTVSILGNEVGFASDGALGNTANTIVVDGGRFTASTTSGSAVSFTLTSGRGIQVGSSAGTSISVAGATGTMTYNGVISDKNGSTGAWAKQGAGVLILGGTSTYSGATTIANGTIQLTAGNNRLPTTTVLSLGQAASANVGTFDLGGVNQTVAGLASVVGTNAAASVTNLVTTSTGTSTLTLNVASGTYTYGDGTAANSVGITKQGAGTQILGGSNSYTRPTTLSAGTLRSGTGTVGNFAFGSGTLALNGGTLTSGTDNGARTFANNVTVGGDVAFGDATATGSLAFSGTVDLGAATRTLSTVQTTTFSGPISNGGLIKSGSALLTLSSSNTYSAGTTVSAGTLTAGNVNAFGSGSMTLSASSTLDLNSLAIANTITNNGGTLANAASYTGTQSLTAAASFGALGGTLSVINGGSASLTGAVTGTVSIAAGGSAVLGNGGSLSQASLSNAGTFIVNKSVDSSLSTAISGAGGFQKLGSGILTVTGNNTFTGATTVSAGGLKVNGVLGSGSLSVAASAWLMGTGTINGPVTISGTLTPGASPGVITLASLVLTPTSSTVIEIASAGTRGTAYDGVSILDAGGLTYGGTMSIVFGGSAIANDTTFDVFSFTGSSTGSLAAVESSGYYAGTWTSLGSGTYQLVKDAQTITFSQTTGDVIVVPEPTAIALAAVGLGAMAYAVRRRYRQA
jgi:autotransporter-associated beta strand protein